MMEAIIRACSEKLHGLILTVHLLPSVTPNSKHLQMARPDQSQEIAIIIIRRKKEITIIIINLY